MNDAAIADVIRVHLRRMRTVSISVFVVLAVTAVVLFWLPRLHNEMLGPKGITLVAAAAALWIGFTANSDARGRLERIKRAHAVHGVVQRLLRDFFVVYLVVLARLVAVAACGVAVSVWGAGPGLGAAFVGLAGLLNLMAWPTEHKTRLLIQRAESLR
jgi:hypothetical protein